MKRFYSESTGCTYLEGIHQDIPADAVEISEARYLETIANPEPGKVRSHDSAGLPVLIDPPKDASPERYARDIAARRYQAETAGIILNGKAIDTGRDSQALVTGAAVAAMLDPNYSCQWKTAGGFIELTAQQILAIATAMRAHVQACFNREAELLAALEAGSFTEAMLDQGWPA